MGYGNLQRVVGRTPQHRDCPIEGNLHFAFVDQIGIVATVDAGPVLHEVLLGQAEKDDRHAHPLISHCRVPAQSPTGLSGLDVVDVEFHPGHPKGVLEITKTADAIFDVGLLEKNRAAVFIAT